MPERQVDMLDSIPEWRQRAAGRTEQNHAFVAVVRVWADYFVDVHHDYAGNCLGGSTTMNNGICFRTPPAVLDLWRTLGARIDAARLESAFDAVETIIGARPLERRLRQHDAELLGGNLRGHFRDVRGQRRRDGENAVGIGLEQIARRDL